ncbi:glycoside hydrolase family 32 protein [Tepidibacter formicigenes]|jgi:beta-fructofuranosidase|uniref:Sucrose-6-phosphate hydrolase n=1 Tax=Tepidibacter formicigenes DSM 15518 TaxID=1123349 RepID=A0A1M6LCQ8_9FIRM|nr:sucrose-6-phosphate hydrolase [Tepidibacter formicigenes]SHJ68962.1 beta-fructofuranosidase [Tepidibacter formicigenes DSM 15518]
MDKNNELLTKAYKEIQKNKCLVESDYYRLKYHIMPPVGLLNDPNGFIHFSGEYHVFYQFHPFNTSHGLKYWGHYKSNDLINWESMPIALCPSNWYESHGCYSGSAINNDGVLTLMYTGNVKDDKGNRETYQCIATTEDGVNFKKNIYNPVIYNQPDGYTRHFRDPKVWKYKNMFYMVIGAQNIKEEGRVLLYKSNNLLNWKLVGEIAGSNINRLNDFGYMWECPDLFELNGKDILIVSPQGIKPDGDLYNNIYQSGYFIGELNYKSGEYNHSEFIELDRGFEFYAPQTTLDEKGRRLLIAWMGLPEEEEHPTVKHNWIHCMSLPRVLELKNNKIYQRPVEELKKLRKSEISYKDVKIENEEIELDKIYGDVLELLIEIKEEDALEYGIKLRCSNDNREETIISYNKIDKKITLNRNKSGKGYKGIRRCRLENSDILKLNIFMDTSSLEIFINNGEEVFSSRIYPDKESLKIKFFAKEGSIKLKSVKKWDY